MSSQPLSSRVQQSNLVPNSLRLFVALMMTTAMTCGTYTIDADLSGRIITTVAMTTPPPQCYAPNGPSQGVLYGVLTYDLEKYMWVPLMEARLADQPGVSYSLTYSDISAYGEFVPPAPASVDWSTTRIELSVYVDEPVTNSRRLLFTSGNASTGGFISYSQFAENRYTTFTDPAGIAVLDSLLLARGTTMTLRFRLCFVDHPQNALPMERLNLHVIFPFRLSVDNMAW